MLADWIDLRPDVCPDRVPFTRELLSPLQQQHRIGALLTQEARATDSRPNSSRKAKQRSRRASEDDLTFAHVG